ncbi:hypothetical protein GCM10027605_08050 [Micromonospora zhanjiangensis]
MVPVAAAARLDDDRRGPGRRRPLRGPGDSGGVQWSRAARRGTGRPGSGRRGAGVGLGTRFAGIPGPDPGDLLSDAMSEAPSGHAEHAPHAKVRAGGHPTPLWSVKSPTDRSAYVGEARGMWLYAITWPASAGYLLAEDVVLHDLTEWLPPELVYGAPSPYLHGMA